MATPAQPALRACAVLCALGLVTCFPTTTQRAEMEQTTEYFLPNSIETQTENGAAADTADGDGCPALVSREEWGAAAPKTVELQAGPSLLAIVHHTYIPGACNTAAACEAAMRSMQRHHQVDRGWNDIGYSFVVGGDGRVYVGRGWGVVGAHALRYNQRSIGVSLIGDYVASPPPEHMTKLAQRLIACSVRRGSLAADYQLLGHRQVRNTQCPGDAFYAQLSAWPHWVARLDDRLNVTAAASTTAAPAAAATTAAAAVAVASTTATAVVAATDVVE